MDHQKRAISWLLINSEQFKIKIESLNWIKTIFPNWTDILCRAQFGSKLVEAWGSSFDEDEALCKAFAEVSERGVFFEDGSDNTNGFAAHINNIDSKKNAALELQERDLFLCHFLTKTPFLKINTTTIKNWDWIEPVSAQSKVMKININYYHLGTSGAICVIDGLNANPTFGYIIGASFKENLSNAAIAATIEAFRRAYFLINENQSTQTLDLTEFNILESINFTHHGLLALNTDYANLIKFLFPQIEANYNFQYPYNQLDWKSFETTELFWKYQSVFNKSPECPFYFAKATSSEIQNLFLGKSTPDKINLKRLNQFLNYQKNLTFLDLNIYPHPFN